MMRKNKFILSCFTFFYLTLSSANGLTQQQLKMLDQLDQLEKLDHMEFLDLNDEANSCVLSRDFTCAENKIAKAKKLASSTSEKNLLQNTRLNLQNERQRIADEERQRAQEERRLAEAEEEMQRAQRRAQEEDEDRGPSTAEMIQQFGTLFAQQYSNNLAEKRASMQLANEITRKRNSDYEAANNRLQESFAKQKAQIEANRIARDRLEQQRQAELLRQQQLAKASQIEIPKFVPQTIVIPTGRTSCPPGSSPARQKNGQYVTSPPEAYCVKDPSSAGNDALTVNTNRDSQNSSESRQAKNSNNIGYGNNPTYGNPSKNRTTEHDYKQDAEALAAKQKAEEERIKAEKARQAQLEEKDDGCILEGTGICRGGATTETRGGTFYVRQPNQCGYKLYMKICIKTKSGKEDCGTDSIRPGGSMSYWHSSDDATGQYTITSVGVLKGGDDWGCMGKKRKLGNNN